MSVVVPTFNRALMIPETIDSILNQTNKNFELIIIDNYSKDNTEEKINEFCRSDNRISYYKNQNNGVIAVNRNFGIKKAKGEYIAFCDDDDLWLPEKLDAQLKEFESDKKLGLVCSNGINFNEKGETGLVSKRKYDESDLKFESLIWQNPIICSSVMLRKKILGDVGLFNEDPELIAGEDYHFWLRISKKNKMKYINTPLIKYRTHSGALRKEDLKAHLLQKDVFKRLYDKKIIDLELYNKRISKLEQKFDYGKFIDFLLEDANLSKGRIVKAIPSIMSNGNLKTVDKFKLLARYASTAISPTLSNKIMMQMFSLKSSS